ncbi:unnamed protein product, partial [Mesorhabditis belari]|uniref:Uncharacterized protein n=1 Tax=Mesorhabditis belari TaxID=2138241 RepID=A0AAF3F3W0_9BILA
MQERGELLQLIEITSDGESRLNERVLGELCRVIGDKPHFVILVRNALQGCGLKAGNAYLQRVQQTMNSVENLGKMMNVLMNGFDRVECFLAPTPGSKVANADGAIAAEDCEKEFLNSLCELANYMISDLEPKTFKDVPLTGKTLMNYVKQLVTHIHIVHKETRGIGNAFEAISRLQFEKAKNSAIAWFNTECEALFARNGYQAMLPKLLAEELDRIKELTMKDYNAAPRFGNARNKAEYEKSFRESIEQKCQQKYEHNDQRYRDSKVATLIQEAYAKYEAEMRPDLALSLGDESRLQKIQQKHPVARSMALGHYDNGVSDLGNLSLIGQKREALSKMIDVK